jgi:FkbM family methyltransferase
MEPAARAKHRAEAIVEHGRAAVAARSDHPSAGPTTDASEALIRFWDQTSTNWYYDVLTAAVIRRVLEPTDMAIDIGAHVGDVLRHMVDAAPQSRHLAVEPLPHLATALRSDFPSVRVEEYALVEEPSGPLQFHHVQSNPGYSGIRQRSFDRPNEEVELIDVETARLDDLVNADESPALIKLDVEGAELGVLRGASRILDTHRPVVIFEHGLGAANHYDTTPRAIHDLLTGHRYEVFLLGTWLEHGPALDRAQFVDQFEQQRNYYFLAAPA